MMQSRRPITILMADDDADDRLFAREALEESRLANDFRWVEDGEELMDYLHRRGAYADPACAPRPGLILLDLNMPRKDGREALQEIRADPNLRQIPVVILTTSRAERDIDHSYDLGVNSFITKPVSFEGLVELMKVLGRYWFEIVELPQGGYDGAAQGEGAPDRGRSGRLHSDPRSAGGGRRVRLRPLLGGDL